MPRIQHTPLKEVEAIKYTGTGKNAHRKRVDGAPGLYLSIRPKGTKSWVQVLLVKGDRRYVGLGVYELSLEAVREIAANNRRIAREGKNPFKKGDKNRKGERGIPTFKALAEEVIEIQTASATSPLT